MPHFTVEVQGETNPLSRQAILSTLTQAYGTGSAGVQGISIASQQLSNWEKQYGYHSLLQDVYADLSVDQSLRFQAIIQLKNGIEKYWRKTATNPIQKNEKLRIRSRAIAVGVLEPVPALALQNALVVAKIARYEFPHDWPDVVTDLIDLLRKYSKPDGGASVALTNVLNITLQVIKELASGMLQRTKKSLQQVALELFQVLGTVYMALVDCWPDPTGLGAVQHGPGLDLMRNSYSALKSMRRLLVAGFEHPHRESDVSAFLSTLQAHQTEFWTMWQQVGQSDPRYSDLLVKHLMQISKLYLDLARTHAASFVLLPGSFDVLSKSWAIISQHGGTLNITADGSEHQWKVMREGDDQDDQNPLEKLSLKALLLFRACLKMVFNPAQTFKYQHPQDKEDKRLAVERMKSTVFHAAFVVNMMEVFVTQYFVLRPSDLRDWEAEPDEWEKREEEIVDAWEFSLRSCSEKLFLDLVINFKELLVPRLLQVFHQYASLANTDVFLKESLYCAIGVAAACVEDKLDFNHFLSSTLAREVQIQRPDYILLRRRTAILLGQWVPIQPDKLDRPVIYQIFSTLLDKDSPLTDHVVRVTAGRQFRMVLEPFEFDFKDFAPYATHVLQSMMILIAETELTETKLALLETVRVAVTKLEGHIEPYTNDIMSMLPPLWANSGEEHLTKQAILTMITALVTSLARKSLSYHPAVLPLIRDSVQPFSDMSVYLLEDGLDLWAAVLQQTPTSDPPPSEELLSLTTCLLPLLETGSEALRQVLDLTESYIILSPATMLQTHIVQPILAALANLLPSLNSPRVRDASAAPHVVETLVETLSLRSLSQQRDQATQHLLTTLINSSYLPTLLSALHTAHSYHTDPTPSVHPPSFIGPGETSLFSILARLILLSPSLTLTALTHTKIPPSSDSSPQTTDTETISWLLPSWLSHVDAIGDISRKKLSVLALTSLVAFSPSLMLPHLQSLMSIWTDILTQLATDNDESGTDTGASAGDYLYFDLTATTAQAGTGWHETPEDERRRELSNLDPVVRIHLRFYVAEKLGVCTASIGGVEKFEREWLGNVDPEVVRAFAALGIPL